MGINSLKPEKRRGEIGGTHGANGFMGPEQCSVTWVFMNEFVNIH